MKESTADHTYEVEISERVVKTIRVVAPSAKKAEELIRAGFTGWTVPGTVRTRTGMATKVRRAPGDRKVALHGTVSKYNGGCRCEPCTAASRQVHYAWMAAHKLAPGDEKHGTYNGYNNYRCRCGPCMQAGRVRQAHYREQQRVRAQAYAAEKVST